MVLKYWYVLLRCWTDGTTKNDIRFESYREHWKAATTMMTKQSHTAPATATATVLALLILVFAATVIAVAIVVADTTARTTAAAATAALAATLLTQLFFPSFKKNSTTTTAVTTDSADREEQPKDDNPKKYYLLKSNITMVHSRLVFTAGGGLRLNLIDTRDTKNRERYFVVRVVLSGDEVSKIVKLMNQRREELEDTAGDDGGCYKNKNLDDGTTTAETCPAVISSRYQILSNMEIFVSCLVEYARKNSLNPKFATYFDNSLFEESTGDNRRNIRFSNKKTKFCTHLSFLYDGGLCNEQQARSLVAGMRGTSDGVDDEEQQPNHGVKIRRLSFENCMFSADRWDRNQTETTKTCLKILAEEGLKENREISSLSVVKCDLRDKDLKLLLQNLPPSVDTLDLSENYCRSNGMAALSSILLNSAGNDDTPSLTRLNLTNQHPGELGGETLDLSLFGLSLPSNNTLVDLDLSFNMLTLHDIHNLVGGLQHNSTLKKLNLMNNRLDDSAIGYIGKHLPQLQLRSLNLSANKFSDTGADSLLKGLEKNYTLWDLSIPRGFAASDRIDFFLAANRGGRVLISHCLPLKEPKNDEKKKKNDGAFSGSSKIGDRDGEGKDDVKNEEIEKYVDQPALPLGIWPLVLKRASHLKEFSPTMRSSVVFHLLSQGLAPIGFSSPEMRQPDKTAPMKENEEHNM